MAAVWPVNVAALTHTDVADASESDSYEREEAKLRRWARTCGAGQCLPHACPGLVEQYSELAHQPFKLAVCDVCGRLVALVTVLTIWVGGGMSRRAKHAWLAAPASAQAALCVTHLAVAYAYGPTRWSVSRIGRVSHCAWAACAVYLAAAPIVLRVLPYDSLIAQMAGCVIFAAATVPALHAAVLPAFLRSIASLPRLRINQHVYFQALVRAVRILDCATGATPRTLCHVTYALCMM